MNTKTWMTGMIGAALVGTTLVVSGMSVAAHERGGDKARGGERHSFSELDTNSDGKVTEEEMTAIAKARFDAADTDGNGKLSAEEMVAQQQARIAARIQDRIARMDADKDGEIAFEEIGGDRRAKGMKRLFEHLDEDGDGALNAEEFENAKGHGGKRRHGGDREQN